MRGLLKKYVSVAACAALLSLPVAGAQAQVSDPFQEVLDMVHTLAEELGIKLPDDFGYDVDPMIVELILGECELSGEPTECPPTINEDDPDTAQEWVLFWLFKLATKPMTPA